MFIGGGRGDFLNLTALVLKTVRSPLLWLLKGVREDWTWSTHEANDKCIHNFSLKTPC